jgi:hypothetical protein
VDGVPTFFLRLLKFLIVHVYIMHRVSQVDLGGHPPFPLNQHFKLMLLINHDIHPFDGE